MTLLHERRLRKPRLSRSTTIFALRIFWVVVVVWCEFGVFFYSLSDCKWPDEVVRPATHSSSEVTPTHVLLLTDARLRNPAISSPYSWFLYDSNLAYLRKSWRVALRLHPDAVMFLGDTFASGRYVENEAEHEVYYRAFEAIFPQDASAPFHLIPGNNDIGLGDSPTFSKDARQFFEKRFGPSNSVVSLAGHQFVMLDAPGLVEEDYRRHAHGLTYDHWTPLPGGPIEFVVSLSNQDDKLAAEPKILLSHIPLSRPTSKSCGPLREKGTIHKGAGLGYQAMLGKQTTDFLLKVLQPSVVFSGDNLDYCEITHEPSPGSDLQISMVREVTLKSFSPGSHIRRPGFQLLSLVPPSSSPTGPTFADVPCHLPDTRRIFHLIYVPCLALTALALLYMNFTKLSHRRKSISPISLTRHRRSSPPPEPESAIWATRTPVKSRVQTSPTAPLPLSMRVPSMKSVASYRASPVSTPQGSPLLSPITLFQSGDERDVEEYVGPSHYSHVLPSGGWHGEHDDGMDICEAAGTPDRHRLHTRKHLPLHTEGRSAGPYFLPPPLSQQMRAHWSFVFWGRRRRMSMGLLDWRSWRSWLSGGMSTVVSKSSKGYVLGRGQGSGRGQGQQGRERGLVWRVASDCMSVAWPAIVAWTVIRWMFF